MKTQIKNLFFVLACFCTLCLTGCGKEESEKVYLSEKWQYSQSGDGNGVYLPLTKEFQSDLTPLIKGGVGYIWVKAEFTIPEDLKDKDLSAYLGRITMADETYLNGSVIGSTGYFPPDEWSSWNTARLYKLPSGLLKNEEVNELKIKIWVGGEGSIVSNPYVGITDEAYHSYMREKFWNSTVYVLFAFALIVIAAYHILLYVKRPKDRENLLFALINLVTALYTVVFYIDQLPDFPYRGMNFLIFQKVFSSAMPYYLVYSVGSFVSVFLKQSVPKYIKWTRRVFLIIPIAIITFIPNYQILRQVRGLVQFFLVPPLLYIPASMMFSLVRHRKDIAPLLFGFSPFVLAIFADLFIHNVLKLYEFPYISMYGWMLVILMLLFILASHFTDARKEAEELNENLEQKVNDRTKELSEANSMLEEASRKAEEDMKLAVYVQQSFYPRYAPRVSDYDIAYVFKPMAGVSGDLFDFYTVGNRLSGAGLFDVSGHGIASGLVTMLAKSIISKEVQDNMNKPLAAVMSGISNKIAEDKGDVENYLTGILLRFENEHVYYVNAGHPAMFYRSASGKVSMANLGGKEVSGGLVGIKNLPVEYTGIKFKMSPGDSIVIYTDCLYESKDVKGQEFGTDRIKSAFEHAVGKSAQEKLDQILAEFNEHTEGVPLKDDLTMIVIQRK